MASRLELQTKLEELMGNKNVYYQPSASIRMSYPCIVYSLNKYDLKKADNALYLKQKQYQIMIISRDPDHPVIDKLLELNYSYYDRRFIKDNLYHDIITLYY